jgi:hypothetical protein
VIVIDYIDNKRNSIAIFFFCDVTSIVGGQGELVFFFFFFVIITIMEGLGLFFSCCHKYNNVRFGFFFLADISIVGGEIYLFVFFLLS